METAWNRAVDSEDVTVRTPWFISHLDTVPLNDGTAITNNKPTRLNTTKISWRVNPLRFIGYILNEYILYLLDGIYMETGNGFERESPEKITGIGPGTAMFYFNNAIVLNILTINTPFDF